MRMSHPFARSMALVACCIGLGCPAVVHAQAVVAGFNPGANGIVNALAVQPDGKIVVGGDFTALGNKRTTPRNFIGRLNADGSLDTAFNPGAGGPVDTIAVQRDGKILVGGRFHTLAGVTREHLGRLNADGSIDVQFNPGANDNVMALTLQQDGKILVGGAFTWIGSGGTGNTPRANLARLDTNGFLDDLFASASSEPRAAGSVGSVIVQPDGKILVAGPSFIGFLVSGNLIERRGVGRLNADGSLDYGFNAGADGVVRTMALQPDGKIIVAGDFTMLGGGGTGTTARNRIGRFNANGTLDNAFDPGADQNVNSLALQPDGKIVAGGNFSWIGGGGTGTAYRRKIGRLNGDGSIDTSFDAVASASVNALVEEPGGKILVGGDLFILGGDPVSGPIVARDRIGQLTNPDPAIQTLAVTDARSRITWSRSSAGPEILGSTFDTSGVAPAYPLLIDTALYTQDSTITDVVLGCVSAACQ
jgi:uncharacterized delta-60 repeat protein